MSARAAGAWLANAGLHSSGFDLGSRESFTAMAKVVATPNGALLREITVIDSQQVRP
jgi:hypothetical protein